MTANIFLKNAWVEFPKNGARSNGDVPAIKNLSLSLSSGDRLGIFGPNGSGKTTLLRLLSGIYHPTRGFYRSEGRVSSMLDLNTGMNPKATGRDYVFFRNMLMGRSRSEGKSVLDDVIQFSGLDALIDQPVATYSSGMKMKLFFSCATAVSGEILLMDEWLNVGDEEFRAKARKRMERFSSQAEILVISSHSRRVLSENCNKFLELNAGVGTPREKLPPR